MIKAIALNCLVTSINCKSKLSHLEGLSETPVALLNLLKQRSAAAD